MEDRDSMDGMGNAMALPAADVWDPDEVLAACRTSGPGPCEASPSPAAWRVLLFDETASTNDIALREAAHGHPAGLVVAAASQTKGRGRQGRPWISPRGAGLYVSVLLRPELAAAKASRLTAVAAVAVAQAIESLTDIPVSIKWPNDLHIRGRKVGGVLIEAGIQAGQIDYAVVGIGINVVHKREDFPEELRNLATSLAIESAGETIPRRVDLLARLMDSIAASSALPFTEVQSIWTKRCHTLGRVVTVRHPDGTTLRGTALRMDETGVLHLQDEAGDVHTIHAGEVLS